MPGVISTGLYERDLAVSDDGEQMIYTLGSASQDKRVLAVLNKRKDGTWTVPTPMPFSGNHQDIEPFFAPGSKRLYFASNRPITETDTIPDYNIWYVEKENDKWGAPVVLPEFINTDKNEFYPSVTSNGHLYFTAIRPEGVGSEDIYRSEFKDGAFQPPVPLDTAINSKTYEFNAYVSPKEDLLIFSSYGRTDDMGGGDLYYSTKLPNGKWSQAIHIKAPVNSNRLDYCPFVDMKAGRFYFTSERLLDTIQQTTAADSLQGIPDRAGNGLGDIYAIPLDSVISPH